MTYLIRPEAVPKWKRPELPKFYNGWSLVDIPDGGEVYKDTPWRWFVTQRDRKVNRKHFLDFQRILRYEFPHFDKYDAWNAVDFALEWFTEDEKKFWTAYAAFEYSYEIEWEEMTFPSLSEGGIPYTGYGNPLCPGANFEDGWDRLLHPYPFKVCAYWNI